MTKNWINFRFLHICPVEKCEISPNLAKIHISPHLLCGKTEIPLHVEKFHVLKSEISPHGRFLLHQHVGDRGDKYEVCFLYMDNFSQKSPRNPNASNNTQHCHANLCENKCCLPAVCLFSYYTTVHRRQ